MVAMHLWIYKLRKYNYTHYVKNDKKNYFHKKKALKTRNYKFMYYLKIYLQVKTNDISASLSPSLSSKT